MTLIGDVIQHSPPGAPIKFALDRIGGPARIRVREDGNTVSQKPWTVGLFVRAGVCAVLASFLLNFEVFAQPSSRLLEAAKRQDWTAVRTLVTGDTDVNASTPDGATALHWAVHWDNVATIQLLLGRGAKADVSNALGITPLMLACANGSAAAVERLLKAGANPNAASATGETTLMMASRAGSAASVRMLVDAGAKVAATESRRGQTALMWAAAEGHEDVVRLLVEAGSDVNGRSRLGFTPLMFAARTGDAGTARVLLTAGADINATAPDLLADEAELEWRLGAGEYDELHASGGTSVLIAIMSANYDVAKTLLESGANSNAGTAGYTALHAAVLHGHAGLVEMLVARGATVDLPIGRVPRRRILGTDTAFAPPYSGMTPIFLAAKFAHPEIVRILARAGANPLFTTPAAGAGGAAFLMASTGSTNVLMAAAGAGWGSGTDRVGRNLIGAAYQDDGSSLETVRAVWEAAMARGADPAAVLNAKDAGGQTALHAAAAHRLDGVIKFLVEKGADVHSRDERGRTPLALVRSDETAKKTTTVLESLGAKE